MIALHKYSILEPNELQKHSMLETIQLQKHFILDHSISEALYVRDDCIT